MYELLNNHCSRMYILLKNLRSLQELYSLYTHSLSDVADKIVESPLTGPQKFSRLLTFIIEHAYNHDHSEDDIKGILHCIDMLVSMAPLNHPIVCRRQQHFKQLISRLQYVAHEELGPHYATQLNDAADVLSETLEQCPRSVQYNIDYLNNIADDIGILAYKLTKAEKRIIINSLQNLATDDSITEIQELQLQKAVSDVLQNITSLCQSKKVKAVLVRVVDILTRRLELQP